LQASLRRLPRGARLLIGLFVLSLPAVTPRIYSSDEIQYFAYLRSLWFDHDVAFENEYRWFYDRGIGRSDGFRITFLELETPTHRRVNFGTIGCAILWAPFYAAGDVTARVLHAAGRDVAVDGFSKPYIAAVAYGSAFYGLAALLLAFASARRLGFDATVPVLAIWLGTPILFYMYVAPPMSHACSAFAVALFVWTWLRVRGEWSTRGMAALGATGALMAMVREQDLFFAAGPALDFGLWALGSRTSSSQSLKPKAQGLIAAATAFAVVFAPQAAAYVVLNGRLGPSQLVTRKMSWSGPHVLQVLFSPEHGFFVWTPIAMLAIAGLVMMTARAGSTAPDHPQVGLCLLLMIALQVYVGGSVESWTVAGGYGQRRFVALTAILVIGFAALGDGIRSRAGRRALAAVTVLAVYWNLALIAEFATGLMDRQRLEPARNAYDAVVTLPARVPDLAYRYLFDRRSFYAPRQP
jgi:hypothetical protein